MIFDFFRRNRRKALGVGLALALPALLLGALVQMSEPISHEDAMSVAAIALHDHYSVNPPYGVWSFDGVRITDDERLVVDVHVTVIPHATFIETRNKRIRYSYLKLACPPENAWVYEWLHGRDRIWINLHHHGKTLMQAPCPSNNDKGFFS